MLAIFKGVNKIKWAKVDRIRDRENKKIKDERSNCKEKTDTER